MSNLFKFAENILNNLDQSTQSSIQTALHKSSPGSSSTNSTKSQSKHSKKGSLNIQNHPKIVEDDDFFSPNRSATPTVSSSASLTLSQSTSNLRSTSDNMKTSSTASLNLNPNNKSAKNSNKEDELIDFLNNSDLSDLAEAANKSIASSQTKLNKKQNDLSGTGL
jgi:hypothetical protein